MFSLRNKKALSLNYPQYHHLSGAQISSDTGLLHNRIMTPTIHRIMTPNKQEYLSLIAILLLQFVNVTCYIMSMCIWP